MSEKIFKNLSNIIDFFLRKHIKFSRKYAGKNELKDDLFNGVSPEKVSFLIKKEQEFFYKYNLENLKNNSTKRIYLENLAIIELLEHFLFDDLKEDNVKILDIGSKNWFYAHGEYSFFKYANSEKQIYLDGIEIDAYRMYTNFHSRYDYANYYIKGLENTRYMVGDFLNHNEKYNYITWFFPFVTKNPLLEWGLPLSTFNPDKMLLQAFNLLEPGGRLLIVNQDENEYSIQHEMLKLLNIPFEIKGMFNNLFVEYEHKRFVTIVEKAY